MARIAYISFDQLPAAKGASTHIQAFARGLAAEFGAMHLVTVSASGRLADPIERWPGVHHWELPALGTTLIERSLCFGRFLTRWLDAREFDAIHFRSIFEGLPILRCRKRAALVVEVNGLPSIELKYRYPGSEDDRELMRKLELQECACLRAADRIVTPSAVTREFLINSRQANRKRIEVIPNGVDTELFRPRGNPPSQSPWRLLYFGTLSPWQGVDLAIRAVQQADGVSLTILGTGTQAQKKSLTRLSVKLGIAHRVSVQPPVPQCELAEELSACNAVLSPLTWNDRNAVQGCCPLKVLEGLAAGRPVITSDLQAIRELGINEEHLLLCKAGSVDAIAHAIGRLRDDPRGAAQLASNGRRLIEERYTWRHAVAKLSALYRQMFHEIRGEPMPLPPAEAVVVPGRN